MRKIIVFLLIVSIFSNITVFALSKEASLEYAQNHFNDGKGLCAEFVADCLRAGGLEIKENECNELYNELTVKYGYGCYPIAVEKDGRISLSKNSTVLGVGDLIIQECHECKTFFHIVICGGEYNDYVTFYAHNAAHGNTKKDVFYNVPNNGHKGHTAIAYSIKISDDGENFVFSQYDLYTVKADSGLNLRKTACLDGEVLTTVPYGTVLVIYPEFSQEGWFYTCYDGNRGFVCDEYLKETIIHKDTQIEIKIGEKTLDLAPVIIEGRSLLPVRDIFESFGGEVLWNDETKTAEINIDGKTVTLKHLERQMYTEGEKKELIVPSVIIDGRMYVGARGVSEGLGKEVKWENGKIFIS